MYPRRSRIFPKFIPKALLAFLRFPVPFPSLPFRLLSIVLGRNFGLSAPTYCAYVQLDGVFFLLWSSLVLSSLPFDVSRLSPLSAEFQFNLIYALGTHPAACEVTSSCLIACLPEPACHLPVIIADRKSSQVRVRRRFAVCRSVGDRSSVRVFVPHIVLLKKYVVDHLIYPFFPWVVISSMLNCGVFIFCYFSAVATYAWRMA
jgi:hypothetical protein